MRTRAQLKSDAKMQLDGKKGTGALIVLVLFVITLIPQIVSLAIDSEALTFILNLVVQVYVTLLGVGVCLFYLAVRKGKPVSVGMLFSGSSYYLKGFGIAFISAVLTGIGCCLFIIPGIILALMYSQAMYIYIENPEMGVIEALKTSRLAMQGHKADFFVLQLSFIGWGILTAITFGILTLYVTPYYGTTLVNFYTDLMEEYKGADTITLDK